jgi:ubiquinone/menaquinone biosynthesis C-methylase UbiE
MTDQAERFDRVAEGYARWWAPFLAPAADELLDRLAPLLPGGPLRILDVGTGTGTLGLGAAERWADASVVGIDASGEMIAAAEAERDRRLGPGGRHRFSVAVAGADRLPYPDGSFDVAMSSFVLQLVPDRYRALREIRRALRPGAPFGFVTWLRDTATWAPDEVVDEVLDEFGVEPDDEEEPASATDAGDPVSVDAAVREVRRAGFRAVEGAVGTLAITFDVESYIGFLTEFDDPSLFEALDASTRARLLGRLRERLGLLDPDRFAMAAPIVFVIGRRGPG